MIWLDHYLQMWEIQANVLAATREDDTEEYHSDTDSLIANSVNLNTIQGFSNVESVASDNLEMQNSYKPAKKLSEKNKKNMEEVVDDAGLDLMRAFRENLEAK